MNTVDHTRLHASDATTAASVPPKNWRIIPFIAPGLPRTAEEDHAIRSHVRTAVYEAKASKPVRLQFKLVDVEAKRRRRKGRRIARMGQPEIASKRVDIWNSKGIGDLSVAISHHHPFADIASQHVKLPAKRIQYLFKSRAFRSAAEPLFETTHVDANMNMLSVFPGCENDSVFMNALTYAMILMESRCEMTREALLLQGDTIRLLNARLNSESAEDLAPITGAVMLLRSVAYKADDAEAYHIHTEGLSRLLRITTTHLTAAAHRAVFWLNLFSVLLNLDACGGITGSLQTQEPRWLDCYGSDPSEKLPVGFARYRCMIPDHIFDCTQDTIRMQSVLRDGTLNGLKWEERFSHLDAMQASIEYRLVKRGTLVCESPMTEGIRLCVFMVCFFSWIETWGSTHIPCRVVDQLLDMIRKTFSSAGGTLWLGHVDLLLWFLFIASNVVEREQGHVPGLMGKRDAVLSDAQEAMQILVSGDLDIDLDYALTSFIYCDKWVEDRARIRAWVEFETSCVQQGW